MKIYKKNKKHPWGYDWFCWEFSGVSCIIITVRGGMMMMMMMMMMIIIIITIIKKEKNIPTITMLVKKGQHSVPQI